MNRLAFLGCAKDILQQVFDKFPKSTIAACVLSGILYLGSDAIRLQVEKVFPDVEYIANVSSINWQKEFILKETALLLADGTYEPDRAIEVLKVIDMVRGTIDNFPGSKYYQAEVMIIGKYRSVIKENL